MFKDLQNDLNSSTKNARSQLKSIKIDKICDVMWWTSDSKQSLNILCLAKYLSESFESLTTETTRHYAKDLWKILVVIAMMSVPGPFNGYHEMKHNSEITSQNQLEFWNQKAKQGFSWQPKNFGLKINIFNPRPSSVKSLKEAWDRQSLIDNQTFAIANYTSSWTLNVEMFYLILKSIYWAIVYW